LTTFFFFAWPSAGIADLHIKREEFMKKSCFLVAMVFSFFSFCTNDNSNNPTTSKRDTLIVKNTEYTDSIVVELYSFSIWCMQHNPNYFGPLTITPKAQNLLTAPLDANLKYYNTGAMVYPIFTPKYPPNKFEAFVYDSVPFIDCDSLNPGLLIKSFSNSRTYMYCLDTASVSESDSVSSIEKCISRPDVFYIYGFGFHLDYFSKWGMGKIKIYYN
jgi:hypothetical protein